jgi:rhombotail lipoprotein
MSSQIRLLMVLIIILTLNACATQQTGSRSSVVNYLYPDKTVPENSTGIPHLTLPLRMGIAFVPASSARRSSTSIPWVEVHNNELTENHKLQILSNIAAHFTTQSFVEHIEIIPSAYLTPGGSFANLDQLKAMFNIDVIALVSYDQVQFTDDSKLSLSYLTLVGAYLVAGQRNDSNTLMDTAVYAIDSRKLLFRAPGTSQLKGRSTPVNLQEELRQDSLQGFMQASNNMTANLELQLEQFKQRLKQQPQDVQLSYQRGYSGGTIGIGALLLLLFIFSKRVFTSATAVLRQSQ